MGRLKSIKNTLKKCIELCQIYLLKLGERKINAIIVVLSHFYSYAGVTRFTSYRICIVNLLSFFSGLNK